MEKNYKYSDVVHHYRILRERHVVPEKLLASYRSIKETILPSSMNWEDLPSFDQAVVKLVQKIECFDSYARESIARLINYAHENQVAKMRMVLLKMQGFIKSLVKDHPDFKVVFDFVRFCKEEIQSCKEMSSRRIFISTLELCVELEAQMETKWKFNP